MANTDLLAANANALSQARRRNLQIQKAFRAAAERQRVVQPRQAFVDHGAMPIMRELNGRLATRAPGALGEAFAASLAELDIIGRTLLPLFEPAHDAEAPPQWLYEPAGELLAAKHASH